MTTRYTTTLTIAGSDPSAGAGIQADLKTFAALGCYGLSVITALTAQNTQGVQGIQMIPDSFVTSQLESLYQDINIGTVKTGMLHHAGIIKAVAHFFNKNPHPLVVDPVMVAKDGSLLLEPDAIRALKENLLPKATLLTPNLPEAEALLDRPIQSLRDMEQAAKLIIKMGPQAVLIKGGHLASSQSQDCFYSKVSQQVIWFDAPRIDTNNTHGTGCTLSAAIAAFLARGNSLIKSVELAKAYLSSALQAGAIYRLGQGNGPVHHLNQLWQQAHVIGHVPTE